MPMPGLMYLGLDPRRLAGRIPVMFSVRFWGELRSLATQKQGDSGQVYLSASGQFEIEIKRVAL